MLLGAGALAVVASAFALRPAWGVTIVVALYSCARLLPRAPGRVTVDVRRVGVARYAWREITAVREVRRRGSREVRLLLIDGRAVRLPAPGRAASGRRSGLKHRARSGPPYPSRTAPPERMYQLVSVRILPRRHCGRITVFYAHRPRPRCSQVQHLRSSM
ncbi:hypothetical protein ACFRCG_29575 [Embleya sp. NPDC056575]|uniref:hypothetical protein n=1 Tax=unclassified Embleya TaxID=2699296 RepID=UPI0036B950DD